MRLLCSGSIDDSNTNITWQNEDFMVMGILTFYSFVKMLTSKPDNSVAT